jgi:hypothetical protein
VICTSLYATQLERYLALFPTSQLRVVDQHDLKNRREDILADLFAFLGVDPDFRAEAFSVERNTREQKYVPPRRFRRQLYNRVSKVGRAVAPKYWETAGPSVLRALSSPMPERPTVSPELRSRLVALLGPEVERLRALTGQRFAHWSL